MDHPIVVFLGIRLHLGVRSEKVLVALGEGDQPILTGGPQVDAHPLVVGEHGGGGAQLGAHVGNGRLPGGADSPGAGTDVLHDGVGAASHGQLPGHVEDDVLGRGPAAHLAGEVDGDVLRVEDLPGEAGHDLHCVGAADANRTGAQAAGVGGMGVGADDELAGKSVILQHHLVDDAGTGAPETDAVLGRCGPQEAVDLFILGQGLPEVMLTLDPGLDEVVAVLSGGDRDAAPASLHELEHSRLTQHVLEDDAVRAGEEIAHAGLHLLVLGVIQVPQ